MIVCSDRQAVMSFFHDRLGLHFSSDFRGILWIPEEFAGKTCEMSDVAVAAGFNSFIGKTCCIHTVVQNPRLLTRQMISEAFNYAYNTCGVEVIFGLVDSENEAAVEFNKRLGFRETQRHMDAGIDGDLIIFAMRRSECRWLKENRNGKEKRAARST